MADWTNPVLTSQYTALLDILKDRDFDLATMFSPTFSTGTNIPEGAVRWNPTSKIWEIRNASAGWDPLVTKYNIDVDKLDGQHGSYYLDWNNFTNKPATFTPTSHTHDDRYYTETEADGRFGFTLDNNGNNIRLKAANGTVLSTLQVAYAAAAGNATTVAGFNVNQDLRTTDSPTFVGVTTTGDALVQGDLFVGKNGAGNAAIHFYDDANDTRRTLIWHGTQSEWQVEDSSGAYRRLFHEGHLPTWSEVSGKPSTFAPSAHGHVFDNVNKLILRTATAAGLSAIPGSAAELIYNDTDGRLFVMDGVTLGGHEVAYRSDIPAPQNLSNYARKDQAETFSNTLTVNGNLTTQAQAQMLKGRILDNSAAAAGKIMLSIEGDSDALQIINYSAGDYEIRNPGRGNAIALSNSTGGVVIRTNSATRLLINDAGIDVTGAILANGNTVWHAGNDGAGSGLDADLLDGKQSGDFFSRNARTHTDVDLLDAGVHGIFADNPNTPAGAVWGVLTTFRSTDSSSAVQLVANHYSNGIYYRSGNPANFGGTGSWQPWRQLWHDGNDGAGSGLDADKLDGIHASSFLRNDQNNTIASKTLTITGTSTIAGTTWNNGWLRIGTSTLGWSFDSNEIYGANGGIIGTLAGDLQLYPAGDAYLNSYRILTTADDGNLDAATLDGLDSSQFLRADATDTGTTLNLNSLHLTLAEAFSWENGTNWITHNDGGGNVQIRFGHKWDNSDERFTHTGTALYIGGNQDSASGTLKFKVATNGGAGVGAAVVWGPELEVGTTDVKWNSNVIWHAGNDGAGSGLDADLLDGIQASSFLRSDQSGTFVGNLTLNGTLMTKVINGTGQQIVLNAGESASYAPAQTSEKVYLNAEAGVEVNTSPDNWASGWAGRKTTFILGDAIYVDGNKVFHEGYRPNADKWTTARTITLGGDLNGSVSLDGSSNVTLTATVLDDSHNHDGRYFTETEADARFVRRDANTEFNVGRGAVYIEDNSRDNQNGAGITLRASNNPTSGSPENTGAIFAIRSSGQALRFWVGQSITSTGDNDFETKDVQAETASGNWIATQAEAEAGTATNKIMTPERTAQAIAELSEGGLPRLTAGSSIRSRVDAEVSSSLASFSTRHLFNFMQKGTVRVSYDFKQEYDTQAAQVRVRRLRNNVWTTLNTYIGTAVYVTRSVDVAVMPGDQVRVEYRGDGLSDAKGELIYYGYIRNVRFQTGGEDLYPGVQSALEGNSA